MKKFALIASIICLCLGVVGCKKGPETSAGGDQTTVDSCEQQKTQCCAHKALMEQWANFENLTEEEQTALIAQVKPIVDEMLTCSGECKHEEGETCKCAEYRAAFAEFENRTIAEQKQLIDEFMAFKHEHDAQNGGCANKCSAQKEGEHQCCGNNAEGHQCQNGGEHQCSGNNAEGHQCQNGGEHQCQH